MKPKQETTPKCEICGRDLDPSEYTTVEYASTCDRCWYGMRMDPAQWKRALKKEGIEVERTQFPIVGKNIRICGDMYQKKTPKRKKVAP